MWMAPVRRVAVAVCGKRAEKPNRPGQRSIRAGVDRGAGASKLQHDFHVGDERFLPSLSRFATVVGSM